jgi:hypothetical protein
MHLQPYPVLEEELAVGEYLPHRAVDRPIGFIDADKLGFQGVCHGWLLCWVVNEGWRAKPPYLLPSGERQLLAG